MNQGHPTPITPMPSTTEHQDRMGDIGDISKTYWGLIHKPIAIPKALRIPKAKEALDKEWDKLQKKRVWIMETVEDKHIVERRCQLQGIERKFCTTVELRHNNNSELEFELPPND